MLTAMVGITTGMSPRCLYSIPEIHRALLHLRQSRQYRIYFGRWPKLQRVCESCQSHCSRLFMLGEATPRTGSLFYGLAKSVLIRDQRDNDECSSQVRLMREIYASADNVWVWLGLTSDESTRFQCWEEEKDWFDSQILKLSAFLEVPVWEMDRSEVWDLANPPQGVEPNAESLILMDFPSTLASRMWVKELSLAWRMACKIEEAPRWKRLWIYQEFLANSRTYFLIGHHLAPWQDLGDALEKACRSGNLWDQRHHFFYPRIKSLMEDGRRHLDTSGECLGCSLACPFCNNDTRSLNNFWRPESFQNALPLQEWPNTSHVHLPSEEPRLKHALFVCNSKTKMSTEDSQYHMPLTQLLGHAGVCNCLEPRDRVYGILGLADPQYKRISIDYTAPLSDLLLDVAEALIQGENCLRVSLVKQNETTNGLPEVEGVPSWVPTWNTFANTPSYRRYGEDSDPDLVVKESRPGRLSNSRLSYFSSRTCKSRLHSNHHEVSKTVLEVRGVLLDVLVNNPNDVISTSDRARVSMKGLTYRCITPKGGDEVWAFLGSDERCLLRRHEQAYKLVGGSVLLIEGLNALAERSFYVLSQDIDAIARDVLIV